MNNFLIPAISFFFLLGLISCNKESPTESEFQNYPYITIELFAKHTSLSSKTFTMIYENGGQYSIIDHFSNLSYGYYQKVKKNIGVIRYYVMGDKHELYLKFFSRHRGKYEFYVNDQICEMGSFTLHFSDNV